MWIAKNKDTGFEYPKKFSSIYDCQNYIDNELKSDLKFANDYFELRKIESILLKNPKAIVLGNEVLRFLVGIHCNRILCYNTTQKRFCDGFDF